MVVVAMGVSVGAMEGVVVVSAAMVELEGEAVVAAD